MPFFSHLLTIVVLCRNIEHKEKIKKRRKEKKRYRSIWKTFYIDHLLSCLGKSICSRQHCSDLFVSLGKLTFQENCALDWINREQAVKRKLLIEKVIRSWTENRYATSLPAFFFSKELSSNI